MESHISSILVSLQYRLVFKMAYTEARNYIFALPYILIFAYLLLSAY